MLSKHELIYTAHIHWMTILEAVTRKRLLKGTIKEVINGGIGVEYIVKPTYYGIDCFRRDADFDLNYSTNYLQIPIANKRINFRHRLNFIMLGGNKYLTIPKI